MGFPKKGVKIHAKMEISQAPSVDNHLGVFEMNFKAMVGETAAMKGYMKASKTTEGNQLQFYLPQEEEGKKFEFSVTALLKSDNSGSGITSMPNWTQAGPEGTKVHKIAFNKDYFYKQRVVGQTSKDPVCLDRNAYRISAYRYGLYDKTGKRAEVNSGFPIAKKVDGKTYHGDIGYHGLWMPAEAKVTHDSKVNKMDYANPDSAGTEYTVKIYGGKLVKHTKNELTLAAIKNIPLNWYDAPNQRDKRVFWDGTKLKVDGQRGNNGQWEDVTAADLVLTKDNAQNGFYFYSQALGGDGQIKLVYTNGYGKAPDAPQSTAKVFFFTRSPVFPGDTVPTDLVCYDRCLNPETLATGEEKHGAGGIFHAERMGDNPQPYEYEFDSTANGMILKYKKDANTKLAVTMTQKNDKVRWGARSGAMFENSTANQQLLQCPWDATKQCPWQAREKLTLFTPGKQE